MLGVASLLMPDTTRRVNWISQAPGSVGLSCGIESGGVAVKVTTLPPTPPTTGTKVLVGAPRKGVQVSLPATIPTNSIVLGNIGGPSGEQFCPRGTGGRTRQARSSWNEEIVSEFSGTLRVAGGGNGLLSTPSPPVMVPV